MIFQDIFINIIMDCFVVLRKASNPYELWMCLWKAYGDPQVPPFPEDIPPPITPIMVPTTPVEIIPPNALVSFTDPVPATNAPNSVQQETSCLPILASWDGFLPNIAVLFMESYIEDVGDIIDDIHLLFIGDKSSSLFVREHSDPQPLDLSFETDMIVDTCF